MAYTSQIKKGTAVSGQIKKSTGLTAEARLGPPSGKDGFSPIANVTQTETGAVISITDKDGTTTSTITNGKDGSAGKDGTSVTVNSVRESTADGGSNVVEFSDGKTLTVKNGKTGGKGDPGPVTPQAKFAIGEHVKNQDSVCVIEETGASVSASDNSAYFDKEYIMVEKDTYKLGKDAMLALQNKKLTGNGSVAWKDWDTQPQGWKDSETNHNGSAPICTAKLKVRYADDPVYLSMKLPGEANISSDTLVRPGMRESNGSGTYVTVNNIGATYAVDYTKLPDEVVICIGHMSLYTLSRENNAKWKLHDKQVIPTGHALYYLPWSGSGDQRVNVSASKITVKDDHVRFALKRDDFAPSSSVSGSIAKCLHFWGAHNPLDLADNLAVICFYETWIETPEAVGNVYTAIGCDQKSADRTKITQNFWGRNVLLSTEKVVAMGHNISDALYDELRDTPNDPRLVFADYGTSFSSEYDSRAEVANHNADSTAHPDIREEVNTYMGDMQRRINTISEVVQAVDVLVPSLNLNDGEWEPGYFDEAGAEYVGGYSKQSFRNVNYLPVEGGRKIAVYYDAAEWNNENKGKNPYIVQYDANKNVVVGRTLFSTYTANKNGFELNSKTAYVRLAFHNWADISTPLTDIKMALYYLEDARLEFVEYGFGSEMLYGVFGENVHMTQPDGTVKQLTVVIDSLAKKTDLAPMVDDALAQAKASGDFKGDKGDTGTSVTVKSVSESTADGGSNVVTFSDGKTLTVKNGGMGSPGANGTDGVSPTVEVSKSGKVTTITITDANGTKTATINDGEDGTASEGGTGATGQRGTGILKVTTATTSYTTETGGKNPIKRMALSTIKSEAGVGEVLVGDLISYSYYLYHIYYVDSTYAYMDTYVSIRGAAGKAGTTPVRGTDYWTADDIAEIKSYVDDAILGGAW